MKILILGGAGFIGSHLVDYHLNLNDSVVAVDDLSSGKIENLSNHKNNTNFRFYKENILTWPEFHSVVAESDIIYDMAAVVGMYKVIEEPISTLHVNIQVTEKLLAIVSKLQKKPFVLIASSSEVYGSNPEPMKETDPLVTVATNRSHAGYPISKLCNEITGMAYHKEKKLPLTIVRLFNTVGTRQTSRYGMVLPRFVQQACSNEDLTIFSDGLQTRSFCDVRDSCQMLYRLTQSEKAVGEIVNLGNDKPITILDLAKLVIKLAQSKSGLIYKSYEEAYGKEYIDIQHRRPDLTKLASIIDYKHQWTLEMTIQGMIDHLKSRN